MQNFNNYIIHIETLGCRLNQIESESIATFFSEVGFSVQMKGIAANAEVSTDVLLCIVNTCTVTQKSEQKARRIIRLLLKKFPNALVLVTGCYAQLNSLEINAIDSRIITLGGQVKSRIKLIPQRLRFLLENELLNPLALKQIINEEFVLPPQIKPNFPENSFELSTSSFIAHSRASLKIQDGCNNNCSYCAIHMARGFSVSLPVEDAVKRVQDLEQKGVQEVVITTVNIAQYRSEYNGQVYNFSKLLKLLLESTSNIMFRISSLYPEIVTNEFCNVIKDKRVCPHFHISVQSGSDKILKLMNRTYEKQAVIDACNKIRSVKDNPFIACDIITGFPGETEVDFQATLDLCNVCQFAWIHVFPFSERKGTPAVLLKNKVSQDVARKRSAILTDFAINQKIKYIESQKGMIKTAILETLRKPQYVYHCVTDNFIHCLINYPKNAQELPPGTKVQIEIESPIVESITKGGEIEAKSKLIEM